MWIVGHFRRECRKVDIEFQVVAMAVRIDSGTNGPKWVGCCAARVVVIGTRRDSHVGREGDVLPGSRGNRATGVTLDSAVGVDEVFIWYSG
jgi:hypothetical protein